MKKFVTAGIDRQSLSAIFTIRNISQISRFFFKPLLELLAIQIKQRVPLRYSTGHKPEVDKDLHNPASVRNLRKHQHLSGVVRAKNHEKPASKRRRTGSGGGTGGGQIDFVGRRKQGNRGNRGNRGKRVIVIQPWESHVARKIRIFLQRVRQFRFRYFA